MIEGKDNKNKKALIQENQVKKNGREKQKGQLFLHLLSLYSPNPNKVPTSLVTHDLQQIYSLLNHHPDQRSSKILQKIRTILFDMTCFKTPPYHQQNPEFIEIFRRDSAHILQMISPFLQMTSYSKGSVVEVTGMRRKTIKVLLKGKIYIFECTNYKSFKNSEEKLKSSQFYRSVSQIDYISKQSLIKILNNQQQQYQKNHRMGQNLNDSNFITLHQETQSKAKQEPLSQVECKHILTKYNIISPLTPHRLARNVAYGQIVSSNDQILFVDQRQQHYSSVVCSTNCLLLQISYDIAKEVIKLINNDRDRPFIQSLLFKFPMLKYFDVKKYVNQDFMIITDQNPENYQDQQSKRKSVVPVIRQLKIVSSLNFIIQYTGQLYLIISGSATLIIDEISQRKLSSNEYVLPAKSKISKQILSLYQNDLFGFQEIGKQKSASLRYSIKIGSKLLKIDTQVLKSHRANIPEFKKQIQRLKGHRDLIIEDILKKMTWNLQIQQIKRHEHITYSKSQHVLAAIKQSKSLQLTSSNQIRQLKYLGHQNFDSVSTKIREHFSPQRQDIQKQFLSPQIVHESGLGLQFSKNLLKKADEKVEIKDGWIEIRNKKGQLLRKKKVKEEDRKIIGEGKSDTLLRRLGILNSEQIAEHNFEIVTKRPSKYQFEDLKKDAKQFKRIKQKMESLPKLKNLYSKRQNRLFTIMYKKTHL